MKNRIYKILIWLKKPPKWFLALIYPMSIAVIVGALLMLTVDYSGTVLEIFAYVLFALSAILLAYSVYTVVLFAPSIKRNIVLFAERYDFLSGLMHSFGFRTVIFAIASLALSIAFGIFNGVVAIMSSSIWYGALAGYYILLTFLRGGIIMYHNRKRVGKLNEKSELELELQRARSYRNSGALIIILDLALSVAVTEMIVSDRVFKYSGLMIYASAAYAFYKITMSIINLLKARKQDDLTVQAIRNINLADAMVSILALQTALLDTFGSGMERADIFNAATGVAVCLSTVVLGVIMVLSGINRIKELTGGDN